MYKYFGFIACILILSCTDSSKKVSFATNFQYMPQNHNNNLDHSVGKVIKDYQELLKGLSNKDTLFIYQNANDMLKSTDSLTNVKMELDSNIQKIWIDGLNNFNAELQGLQLSVGLNDWQETNTAIHMCGLQLLNLLAQIGYKEHQVYIFNVENKKSEDGFVWLGFQKQSRDPFHPENRKLIVAQEVLQEIK